MRVGFNLGSNHPTRVKRNAFSQEDVDIKQHKVNAKNAFAARIRHYLNYYVMRDLKKKQVTELEMDELQAAVVKSCRHSIKKKSDMQYAITKELIAFNFEQQTTDWLVAEFDRSVVPEEQTKPICKHQTSYGADAI